ncbi:MAG: hypothetical protein IKU03_04000 [Bacteroidales bacterium]|nr:hypothetical protein [Bacteroidales bacterium]
MMTTRSTTDTQTTFVNQKLCFVEDLVLRTQAHIFLTGRAGMGKTTFLRSLPAKTPKRSKPKKSTCQITYEMLEDGMSAEEIAAEWEREHVRSEKN